MTNPYQVPRSLGEAEIELVATSDGDVLARRFSRFVASMVDGLLMMAVLGPVQYLTGYLGRAQLRQLGIAEQLGMLFLGIVVHLALQGYWLTSRGQSIGKRLTKIQIVDAHTGGLLPFHRVWVYRHLWLTPLAIVVLLIPGMVDDLFISLISLVNIGLIFGFSRRCLHDYIAGSRVVEYRPGRQPAV